MNVIRQQTAKITNNPLGAIVGGVAFYFGSKKYAKVSNPWLLGGLAVVGVVVGAMTQDKLKSKGQPTAQTIK
jgi:hypothetical protein